MEVGEVMKLPENRIASVSFLTTSKRAAVVLGLALPITLALSGCDNGDDESAAVASLKSDTLSETVNEDAVAASTPVLPNIDRAPNIIVVMADDLGWMDVGYHGSEIQTPVLDGLAEGGVALDRFYSHPTCSPTRAALMTGKSPLRLGIAAPLSKNNPTGLPLDEVTLAERLKQRGYQTALVGKWHLGARRRAYLPNARGFDHFYGHVTGGVGYWDKVHGGGYDLQRNGSSVRDEGYLTDLLATEAIDVIKGRDKDRPLFLFASFNAPHLPNEAPPAAIEKYEHIEDPRRRVHAAMVSEFDAAVGQLMATLDEEGMRENTLVWFLSDNGGLTTVPGATYVPDWVLSLAAWWMFDVRPTPRFVEFARVNLTEGGASNSPLQGGKASLWEGGMRVPSLVYWKGVLQPSTSAQMIAVQDVLPTLLEVSGVAGETGDVDGRSVWPALAAGADLPTNDVVTQMGPAPFDVALFRYPWKLVVPSDGEVMLFDVEADPTESTDLAQSHSEIVSDLRAALDAFPRGENVSLPFQALADDPDFFGGEEDRTPWAEAVLPD